MIALAHLEPLDAKLHLETSICALFAVELTLTALNTRTLVRKVIRRVRIGEKIALLKYIIQQRLGLGWLNYLNEAIDTGLLPFDNYHTAYNYYDEWWLHYNYGDEYTFEILSNMQTRERLRKAHELRGTLHSDQGAEQLRAQREINTIRLARLIISALDRQDLIEAGASLARGWLPVIFEELMLDAVPREEAAQ
jgi:hypothetical protein